MDGGHDRALVLGALAVGADGVARVVGVGGDEAALGVVVGLEEVEQVTRAAVAAGPARADRALVQVVGRGLVLGEGLAAVGGVGRVDVPLRVAGNDLRRPAGRVGAVVADRDAAVVTGAYPREDRGLGRGIDLDRVGPSPCGSPAQQPPGAVIGDSAVADTPTWTRPSARSGSRSDSTRPNGTLTSPVR